MLQPISRFSGAAIMAVPSATPRFSSTLKQEEPKPSRQRSKAKGPLSWWLSLILLATGSGAGYVRMNRALSGEHQQSQALQQKLNALQGQNVSFRDQFNRFAQQQQAREQSALEKDQQSEARMAALNEQQHRDQKTAQQAKRLNQRLVQKIAQVQKGVTYSHRKFLESDAAQAQVKTMLNALGSKVTFSELVAATQKAMLANVDMRGSQYVGSGTMFKGTVAGIPGEKILVLTNNHLLKDNSIVPAGEPVTLKVAVYNPVDPVKPQIVEAKVIQLPSGDWTADPANDVALLEISTPGFQLPSGFENLPIRDLKKNPLIPGEPLSIIGCSEGFMHNVSFGVLGHPLRGHEMEERDIYFGFSGPMNHGNSGGTAFSATGEYLGIPSAIYTGGDDDEVQGMGFMVRADIIQALLEKWGVHFQ